MIELIHGYQVGNCDSQRLLRGIEFLSGSEVIFMLDKDDGCYSKNNWIVLCSSKFKNIDFHSAYLKKNK